MALEASFTDEISWSRLLPWTRLFRAVGLSIDGRKLILAALGLIVLNLGWGVLGRLLPGSSYVPPRAWRPSQSVSPETFSLFAPGLGPIPVKLAEPAQTILQPFFAVFSLNARTVDFLHAGLAAIWAIVVWGIFGGAISRIALLQAARGEHISFVKALKFAMVHGLTLAISPLCPFLGVALVAGSVALFGLVYRLPDPIGTTLGGLLFFVPLLGGLFLAFILGALAVAWPLIHATVAAEAEDGFDALSRSYAYVHQRPGRYAAYLVIAWLIGCVGLFFVEVFTQLVLHLSHWSLTFTAPGPLLNSLLGQTSADAGSGGSGLHSFWLSAVGLLLHGWIYVYFWTSTSLIYLLLRRSVDGTDLHQVAVDEAALPKPTTPTAVEPGSESAAPVATPAS